MCVVQIVRRADRQDIDALLDRPAPQFLEMSIKSLELGKEPDIEGLGDFAWESGAGAVGRVPAATDFGAGVGEPICASERVMAPSNAAVPQIKSLKRLNIGVNGS